MTERHMRQRVVRALRKLDAVSVENRVGPGTPDVNFVGGWLELKQLKSWPKEEELAVPVKHFRTSQRRWLERRERRGGKVWLLLLVGREEWLLFDGRTAATCLGFCKKALLYALAKHHWNNGLNQQELLRCLRSAD